MGNHNDNKGELTTKKGEIDNQISLNILPSDEINGTTLSSRLVCRARWTYVNLREPRSMSPKLEAISQPVEYLTRQTSWRMKVVLGYIFTFSLLSACRSLKDWACPSNVCLHLSFLVKNRRESLLRSLDFFSIRRDSKLRRGDSTACSQRHTWMHSPCAQESFCKIHVLESRQLSRIPYNSFWACMSEHYAMLPLAFTSFGRCFEYCAAKERKRKRDILNECLLYLFYLCMFAVVVVVVVVVFLILRRSYLFGCVI